MPEPFAASLTTLDRAALVTENEELREWFSVAAHDLRARRRVVNLDEVLLAAERELET